MMQPSLVQALGIIDCSILKRLEGKRFEVVHANNDWFTLLMPESQSQQAFEYAGHSPYLNDFFIDAEEFWQLGNPGQIQSGIWTETTSKGDLHFEAIAAIANGEQFLVLSNQHHEYTRQQNTLQVARELLLTHDKVLSEQETLQNRFEQLLAQNDAINAQSKPLQQALEKATQGVVICDSTFKPLRQNEAAYLLFELDVKSSEQVPAQMIMDIFRKQYPEYERVIATRSRWSGELYWHKPPFYSKWLQLSLHPVLDRQQRLSHWVMIVSDITRVKYLLQHNEKLTLHDALTHLPNRQFLWQSLEQHVSADKSIYLLYMDVRMFKRVNESSGHQFGDKLLAEIAQRMQQQIGQKDFLARIGGDEFAIIHQDAGDEDSCRALSQRLLTSFKQPFYTESGDKLQLGLNIGIAHFPRHANSAEDVMRFADLALFAAKSKNRDYVEEYSVELHEQSKRRSELENALRDAIDLGQFELYLQPILDLNSGKMLKAEALIRWNRPGMGVVMPDEFIHLAEQTGMIVPLGKWVIHRACHVLKQLQQHKVNIKIAINISPRQIGDKTLYNFLYETIGETGINATHLELELTEGVLVDNYEPVRQLLEKVRKLGISVAIDDFGTGYSSLAYLKKLPIDSLKIDRSFVKDLDSDENDKAIVLAVIAMANNLQLGVIAEGVETENQKQFLRENACNIAQGYLFSKPLDLSSFIARYGDKQ